MSVKAFVLIETAVGKTKDVLSVLSKIDGIKSVDAVMGPYDIIAIMEAKDLDGIGSLVTNKVHPISGVNRTVTCQTIKIM